MTRLIDTIQVDFIDPSQSANVSYQDLESSVVPPSARRYQRVILISPSVILYRGDLPRCTYPLGLGYIGAILEQNDYEVQILDCLVEGYYTQQSVEDNGEFIRYGLSIESIQEKLLQWQPDVIGVSSIFSNQSDVIEEIFLLARRSCPNALLITGGAHARYFPQQYLEVLDVDAVFLGESENTIIEFLDWANGGRDITELQGIVVQQRLSNNLFINKNMPLIKRKTKVHADTACELDIIPYPAWQLFNMERYFEIGAYQSPYTVGERVAQVYTSRGCTAKCTFCTTTNFWGGKLRRRSPENVIGELRLLIDRYAIDEFHIQDDNITNDKEHARKIFRAFTEIGLPWCTPQGTALWRMDENMLDLMKASGCYQITFAIESGVQRVLTELICKPLDLKRTHHLIQYARDIGLNVHGFFIIGMPPMFGKNGETIGEMKSTYQFACEAGFSTASFFPATPIVGSVLLNECLRQGFISRHTPLYKMSYKQGIIDVPGLWMGREVAELARQFNISFNQDAKRQAKKRWRPEQY